jgi:dephospho-CoA kinase
MVRDSASKKEVMDRLKNQLDDEDKIPFSDYVLENTKLHKTKLKVEEIHNDLLNNS